MKRLKTLSLFFFVCICLCVHQLEAQSQSSSCADRTNFSVDQNCEFKITPEVLRVTGPTPGSITFNVGTGSTASFVSGMVVGSIKNLGIPNGGVVEYTLYESIDGSGPMLCWGTLNFEIKFVPDPETSTVTVMCSQPPPDLPTIADVRANLDNLCSATVTDLTEEFEVTGDVCGGFVTVRTIRGQVDYHGSKATKILRLDTIIETPLDTSMVVCPLGGPSKLDAIVLFCEDIENKYPTPEVVEEYAAEGIRGAYPHLDKGPDTTIILKDSVIQLRDTVQEKILVTDDFGNEYWVLSDVVNKRDTTIKVPDTTITAIVVPLKDSPVCNLSVKYADQQFPGCAGPDSKIMRTWSILDWCNGSLKECVQWIIVETEGPKIIPIKDAFPGIAPWICTAQYQLTAEVDQGCSETIELIFTTTKGIINENNVLIDLWPDEVVEVIAIAIDDCGQRDTDTFYVTPFDSLPPVAIANDQINVSLSGDPLVIDPRDDRGTAKVYVDAIDEGSHNSGCGEVNKCLLLKEELQDPVIIGGVHVEVGGQPIYHSHGCEPDGILPAIPQTKLNPGRPEIPYVVCKDFIKFCCASLGDNNVAMIVTNRGDREAITWTIVSVEDKSFSIIECPDPIYVGCDEDFEIPRPTIFQSICNIDELEMTLIEDRDNCGNGTNFYTWRKDGEVVCVTEVRFDARSGFNPYEIKWPKHYNDAILPGIRRECELLVDDDGLPVLDSDGNEQNVFVEIEENIRMGAPFECTGDGFTGEPIWCNSSCGLIGVNFEDQTLESVEGCRKIIRTWTIIDWCTWDPNTLKPDDDNDRFTPVNDEWLGEGDWLTDRRTTPGALCEECVKPGPPADYIYFRYDTVDLDGYYSFDQIIKIVDNDEPIVTAPDTVRLSISGGATTKDGGFDECFAEDVLSASVVDFCGDLEIDVSRADWFIQVFKLVDGVPESIATKETIGPDATMSTQQGMTGDVHLIRWAVRDGCGNTGSASTYVLFLEDKKPTPICIQNLSTSTMTNSGTATIWAADFDAGSFDNCSEVDVFFKDEDGNFVPSLTFTCDDIENGISQIFDLELYAVDELGNHDFCMVSLRVDDFNDNCPDVNGATNVVSGEVATAFGDMVEEVMISLDVGMTGMTNVHGKYAFNDILYNSFEIKATKDSDYLNGVTSLDALLIQRHMLALSQLDSPYKLIAADINNDGRVSSLDLVDLRKLILGIIDELPQNQSWRFVSAAIGIDDPESPFPFPESINVRNFDGHETSQNFTGVKIGDVNGNAVANSLIAADSRTSGILELITEGRHVEKGEEVDVVFELQKDQQLSAFQFTLDLEGVEFLGIEANQLDIDDSNFALLDRRTLTTTWYSTETYQSTGQMFTLKLRGLESVDLNEAIAVSSRATRAIAYSPSGDPLSVQLDFTSGNTDHYILYQNMPNPFDEYTSIGFLMPRAGKASLIVFDVTGKSVLVRNGQYNAGYNELIINKAELGDAGVLYYQFNSEDFTDTKKMILID